MLGSVIIQARPIGSDAGPCLLIDSQGTLEPFKLRREQQLTFHIDKSVKYCCGWYDIESHQNHPCGHHARVDSSYNSCFACRKKTDFNPAFYHSTTISDKQARYNAEPHSVYIAYFGGGFVKAGIMSDSRGLDRIYEQGALMYTVVARCKDATIAHNIEARLIKDGLRDGIQKRQKAKVFENVLHPDDEKGTYTDILASHGYENSEIIDNVDTFFYGHYPNEAINSFGMHVPSGKIVGIVGRYLIMENTGRLYGLWLSDLFGYQVTLSNENIPIAPTPRQVSLF